MDKDLVFIYHTNRIPPIEETLFYKLCMAKREQKLKEQPKWKKGTPLTTTKG